MSRTKAISGDSRSLGRQLVDRLERFATSLEATPSTDSENLPSRFTCRTIKLNLQPRQYDALLVKRARRQLSASQAIFAQFLGVSSSTVQDWEQGLKPPSGAACRLMDEIERCPEHFRKRLIELSRPVST